MNLSVEALDFECMKDSMNKEFIWDRVVNDIGLNSYHEVSASKCLIKYPKLYKRFKPFK